jgi:hypothetical protein
MASSPEPEIVLWLLDDIKVKPTEGTISEKSIRRDCHVENGSFPGDYNAQNLEAGAG